MPIHIQLWEGTEGRSLPYEQWLDDMHAHYVNGFFHVWNNVLNHITRADRIREELVSAYELRTGGRKLRPVLLAKHKYGKILFGYGLFREFEMRLANRMKLEFMSPPWKAAFKEYVLTMREYLDSIGITPKDYIVELWDEAHGGTARRVLAAGRYFKEIAPEIRTMMDVPKKVSSREVLLMDPVTDIWCPSLSRIKNLPDELEDYRRTGKEIWIYQCPTDVVWQSPLEVYRKYPWWGWKLRVDGLAYWNYDSQKTDAWNNFDHGGYQDCMMIYPTPTGPIPSRRWEAWREGMQDHLYLHVLKTRLDRAEQSGIAKPAIQSGRNTLNTQVERVLSTNDPETVEDARRVLAETIISLENAAKPAQVD